MHWRTHASTRTQAHAHPHAHPLARTRTPEHTHLPHTHSRAPLQSSVTHVRAPSLTPKLLLVSCRLSVGSRSRRFRLARRHARARRRRWLGGGGARAAEPVR
eukprot:2710383-Pleurochrysis_carterae.AAC.1